MPYSPPQEQRGLVMIIFLFVVSLFQGAQAQNCSDQEEGAKRLECELREIVSQENEDSDGSIKKMECSEKDNGILCPTELVFIETSGSSGEGGGNYLCKETYYYEGQQPYQIQCTTCWFNDAHANYKTSCN